MAKTTIRSLVPILVVSVFVVTGGAGSKASLAKEGVRRGWTICRAEVWEKLAQSPFEMIPEERKSCSVYHSLEGTVSTFGWITHLDRYSTPEVARNGWFYYPIGKAGNFRRTGAEGGKEIKVTDEVAEEMVPHLESWATSPHLDQRHAPRGITCGTCHGTAFPRQRPATEQCLKCHGNYKELVPLTEDVFPNPHKSHLGEIRCTRCHKEHQKSVLYCNKCHIFDLEVP